MFLTFDTETTGLPKNFNAPVSESENWPRLVQLAWQLNDNNGRLISVNSHIIKPDGYSIPYNSEKIHGISTEIALKEGKKLGDILKEFEKDISEANILEKDKNAGFYGEFDTATPFVSNNNVYNKWKLYKYYRTFKRYIC